MTTQTVLLEELINKKRSTEDERRRLAESVILTQICDQRTTQPQAEIAKAFLEYLGKQQEFVFIEPAHTKH